MIIAIESIVLCLAFTLMVYLVSRDPIKSLYNYPPKIQERVKSLDEYKDQIPTQKNKLAAKLCACILFVVVLSLILRYMYDGKGLLTPENYEAQLEQERQFYSTFDYTLLNGQEDYEDDSLAAQLLYDEIYSFPWE